MAALGLLVGILLVGMLLSLMADRWDRERPGGPPGPGTEQERGPGGLVLVVGGVIVVGAAATAFAYRRISRPVGELLGAAEKVAEGDYDVTVAPAARPRELRLLTVTFNDMAGRLAATDEQRRRFLADITHELRTPLAVLQSGIEAQLDGVHPRDDRRLTSLLEETERLGRLVDDLHTLALAEAGRLVLHRETVAPVTLVEEAIDAHTARARAKAVTLTLSAEPGLPDVEVDPGRIRQVLDNVLANALRHAPAESEVRVEVDHVTGDGRGRTGPAGREPGEEGGRRVRITVTDAGPGFPADQLDQVFERFVRAADSRGSGLGLSIARDLVRTHDGTITARNLPTGGAAVTITLPVRWAS